VVLAFHGASPGQGCPVGSSHKGWFSFRAHVSLFCEP
jgi:hypothetical protein